MARPKSAEAHEQILRAALKLFSDRGIDGTSMDAIAATSGVSKATVYKHWPDKDSLCLDVLAHLHEVDRRPVFDSGDIRADLIALLRYEPAREVAEQQRRMMPHLIAYAAKNHAFGESWRARAMEPGRQQIKKLLKRGTEEGILTPQLNLDVGYALLLGPMLLRKVYSPVGKELPPNMAELVVDAFWKAYATGRSSEPAVSSPRDSAQVAL